MVDEGEIMKKHIKMEKDAKEKKAKVTEYFKKYLIVSL